MSASSQLDTRQTLGRVLTSRSFARAEQLRRLLDYLIQATLEGRESTLKETVIGVDVFDLPASFNPKSDPTVRMAMHRLRTRLNQYYRSEGLEDRLVILLEPGRYTPQLILKTERKASRVPLAVLPFESSHEGVGDPECGGLVRDAILEKLAHSTVFRLVGSESAAFMPGADINTVVEKLQVRYVVRGACHADGAGIRVCTELLCPEQHKSIWTGNHGQIASDEIWTVQNVIAAQLEKQVLGVGVVGTQQNAAHSEARAPGIDRLLLQGRYHLHQDNIESIRKAENCFLLALDKQPASAVAWAGHSVAQCYKLIYHMAPAVQVVREAKASADKARALDSSIPEASLAQGLLSALADFKPTLAGQHFERTLALNPENHSVRIMDAMVHLVPLGKLEEAEDQLEAALASDPLNPRALRMMASVFYFQRRYEMAVDLALSALDIMPQSAIAWFHLANSYDRLGREEDALNAFRRCEELMPFMRVLKWPAVLAAVGKNRQKWVRPGVLAAAKLLESSPRAPSVMVADLLIRLGEHERALAWLERAFRERAFRALFLTVDPALDALRHHPRCVSLIEQLKSPAGC